MGASNVAAVCTHWGDLPGDSFKVLTYMALITLDRDEKPTYWGGSEALCGAIGRPSTDPAPGDLQAVRRAIRALVDAGAVSVDKPATRTAPARYQLHLLRSDSERD